MTESRAGPHRRICSNQRRRLRHRVFGEEDDVKNITLSTAFRAFATVATAAGLAISFGTGAAIAADALPNACPVDGCEVKITGVEPSGEELEVTFDSNFTPDVAKNHFHVWWGENFTVEQVGRNAEPVHGVSQGRWHRHADYPVYVTQGAASTAERKEAKTLCVSAADRDHNILDVTIYHCVDVSSQL